MSDPSQQPPGWYYAQGDPPGTQRYWDGTQWQGGPQAAGGTAAQAAGGATQGGAQRAEVGDRFMAFLIDAGIMVVGVIVLVIMVAIFSAISDTLGGLVGLVGYLGIFGFAIYNMIYLQGTTGQSIGKKQRNIKVLTTDTMQPVGIGMAIARWLLQGIFAIPCYLDHWWILVDADNRRLSDKVLDMHVYKA